MSKQATTKKIKASPFLKWAGGKTQLLDLLSKHVPPKYGKYIEPFLGGGAMFFHLQPKQAVLADSNKELVNCFQIVRDDVEELIKLLKTYRNTKAFYYKMRSKNPARMTPVRRAARFIYLNRTCFNGLYRVNKKGQFNVPFGRYKNPTICQEGKLRNAHQVLQGTIIVYQDYKQVLEDYAEPGDFIFFDPPYYPISRYSDFKRYTKDFFYEEDHIDLANEFRRLFEKGCYVLLTNSSCDFVKGLFRDFPYTIADTQRLINKDASKRNNGQDIIVHATRPVRRTKKRVGKNNGGAALLENFPSTRFMGSKYSLLPFIWDCLKHLDFKSVLDLFSGSGCVSYMFKQQGKQVYSNDFLSFCYHFTKSLVENNATVLTPSDVEFLLTNNQPNGSFIAKTFKGLYFTDEENDFLDRMRTNIELLDSPLKKSLALAALTRACLKKRPRGVFTYVGFKYDDGRRDLKISLKDHFVNNIQAFNQAVFSNSLRNRAFNKNSLELDVDVDLVYLDPPYYSRRSDNEYTRRYHFVEGLCRKWEGLDIQWKTKTKKFKKYETPFGSSNTVYGAFESIFDRYRNSIIVVSYSSNSLPNKNELASMLKKFKKRVEVHQIGHKYSFGNQGHKVGDNANDVIEYVFVGR